MKGCCSPSDSSPRVFHVERFMLSFPSFTEANGYTKEMIARVGRAAMNYVTEWRCGFPLEDPEDREYALFLVAAHMLILRKNADGDMNDGQTPSGGRVKKATVGAVSVETDAPNSYRSDDYTYWLSQTAYGQELLALLASAAPAGIFVNCCKDSVRVL